SPTVLAKYLVYCAGPPAIVEAPTRASLKLFSLSSRGLFGDVPTRDIQSLRAVICMSSAPVKAQMVNVLIPLSQLITGSVKATPEKWGSRLVRATIANGPPWTCFISTSKPFLAQRPARSARNIAAKDRPGAE